MFVTSFPSRGSITVEECASPLKREHAVRRGVVDDRVGVLGRRDPAERLERLQIEHHDGLVVARGRESVPVSRARSPCRARR